jgi:hypothetical protein
VVELVVQVSAATLKTSMEFSIAGIPPPMAYISLPGAATAASQARPVCSGALAIHLSDAGSYA